MSADVTSASQPSFAGMGTSLWLVPSPDSTAATALQNVISSLSKAYSSPSFPPHITLASLPACVSLPEIVSCFSSEEPIEVSFEHVRTGQTYFQSVFIAIHASASLTRLHEHIHKTIGVQMKTPEFAHLSLYYGLNNKEEVVHELQANNTIQLTGATGLTVAGVQKFTVEEVWIVNCTGRPDEWTILEKVHLTARNPATVVDA